MMVRKRYNHSKERYERFSVIFGSSGNFSRADRDKGGIFVLHSRPLVSVAGFELNLGLGGLGLGS